MSSLNCTLNKRFEFEIGVTHGERNAKVLLRRNPARTFYVCAEIQNYWCNYAARHSKIRNAPWDKECAKWIRAQLAEATRRTIHGIKPDEPEK